MPVILGIDPGSNITGFGVISAVKHRYQYLASGAIRVVKQGSNHPLWQIFQQLTAIIEEYRPQEVAIERVFMHANVNSALKLGEARGAAIAAATRDGVPLAEYTARQVKLAAVGYGNAEKAQVQQMVKMLLGLRGELQADEADALAIAICHANSTFLEKRLEVVHD